MTKLLNSTVLVTGGASGIGRLIGDICLQSGAGKLVIWDINKEKLDETTRELRSLHFSVYPYVVDVTDLNVVIAAAAKVNEEVGPVDILVNNAGIVTGKNFAEHSHKEIDLTMAVNASALMHITLEFLPGMIARRRGHVVNISSAAGMLANPKMSVYCASKWAVSGWSDSLRLEMEKGRNGVKVTTVNPSYINTGMFRGVRTNPMLPILKPHKLAARVVRAIRRNRLVVRAPFLVRLLPFTKGILPIRLFDLFVGKVLGVYRSMENFEGHQMPGV